MLFTVADAPIAPHGTPVHRCMRQEDQRQRRGAPRAHHDHYAALAGLIESKTTDVTVLFVVGSVDMAAEMTAINVDWDSAAMASRIFWTEDVGALEKPIGRENPRPPERHAFRNHAAQQSNGRRGRGASLGRPVVARLPDQRTPLSI